MLKKENLAHITFLNIGLILCGLALVGFGIALIADPVWSGLTNAFGTTMAATGGVTLLGRLLTPKPKPLGPEKIVMKRKDIPKAIHDRKESAQKIDILGVTVRGFFREVLTDRKQNFVKNVLEKSDTRARIMFTHPDSPFLHQRAHDDGNLSFEELRKRQLAVVEYCVLLFVLFKDRYLRKKKVQHSFEPRGHLTIKLIEACPYISYERYDFDIHWGLYLSGTPGMDSPCFLTSSDDGELYEKLKDHFKYLLDNEYEKATSLDIEKHNILLQITYQKPWLNEELAAHFIGLDRLEELKSQTPEKIINNLNNILEI